VAIEWIIVPAVLLLALTAWGLFVFWPSSGASAQSPVQVRRIRIKGSYEPSEVHVSAGEPARLIFRRQETAPCSERVVFPDLGISVMLPAFEDVAVDLPASEPGEHEFTCQMEMLHGRLVIDPARVSDRAAASRQAGSSYERASGGVHASLTSTMTQALKARDVRDDHRTYK
jgi:Cu+-exporting ATPase